ncbi:aminotransferase class I/II-fold pyridoxal phosphate-dependent enzyme [Bacillus sp. FJAT-42315]|uniref:aminotransferase class I/II-fold pyridoxal phosphate-dependent enzyme n=1 Tax=Bacillus sp. FJAT-42315 TaxID=2014077 RepID=UPI001E544655|nr:aminotransferase class I/II-fold pyridoxal phosphate-dependent enzyme [Bacillus sp. FJAT-42315]
MNQERIPLMEALQRHIDQKTLSFHVPGHKGGQVWMDGVAADFYKFLAYDQTEISDLDDFHSPEGCIEEAQRLLIDLYQTKKSYFLVNGSTVGNLAMVLSVCEEGDLIFVQRNCHKSILNACKLAKVTPVFLEPEYDASFKVASGVSLDTVEQAYKQYDSVKAIVLTYPNYYGMATDIEQVIKVAQENGSFVLVDEAHGPHFVLGEPFPNSSLQWGADLVVHSAHKMLPAMTMGSFLHMNSSRVSLEKLEFYLQALQSSSPSYPIMASLDVARAFLAGFSYEDVAFTLEMKTILAERLQGKGLEVLLPDDPLKLLLRKQGYTGYELQSHLEAAGVYSELSDASQVLCTLPLLKAGSSDYIELAKRKIDGLTLYDKPSACEVIDYTSSLKKTSMLMISYKEQEKLPRVWIPLTEAVGEIAAETVIPYPPGIPLLIAGEQIAFEQIATLTNLLAQHVHIQGGQQLNTKRIAVYRTSQA